ncbi:MAG TPA: lipid-binding SYLF domain-containing protein [Terriglobales bacterium]|nr:lipid-binding SYLF domain-containing protein [Terriglobales bacterium]
MKRSRGAVTRFIMALSVMVMCFATVNWAVAQDQQNQTDVEKRIKAAAGVLDEIMGVKDKAIPDKIMSDAKCVAVVPNMVKLAIGFGGSHGKGVATCRTARGWSAPAPFTITGGSWGLQLGGQAIDLVMLVMNQKGMDDLLSSKFKIGGDASAAAGPVGREAAADTDWKMKAEILSYSRARGVFAGVDLSGSKVSQDRDETHILYGKMIPFATILSGKVAPPNGSEPFLAAVRKYSMQSRDQGSLNTSSETTTAKK